MKNLNALLSLVFMLLMVTMSSCDVIGDIFEAGMWVMLIIIAVVILVIMWIVRKIKGPRGPRI